jgi:hypothetical protein
LSPRKAKENSAPISPDILTPPGIEKAFSFFTEIFAAASTPGASAVSNGDSELTSG